MKYKLKLKPDQWTHHHTHRLYHISMGVCFGFISLAVVGVMATVWVRAGAIDVSVTAQVNGISPGPITGGGGGGPAPAPTPNPQITMVAEPQGQITQQPINTPEGLRAADVFPNLRPTYSGTTSVSNGLVFLSISGSASLNSTAQADSSGNWIWQSPVELIEGSFSITATVYDSYDLTRSGSLKKYFIIELPAEPIPGQPPQTGGGSGGTGTPGGSGGTGGNPKPIPTIPTVPEEPTAEGDLQFGIFIKILDESKYVTSGDDVVAAIALVSNKGQQVVAQDIEYKIISPNNEVILETTDTVSFSKQAEFLKTFTTAPETPTGEYTLQVSSKYNGVTSRAQDKFRILSKATPTAATQEQGPIIIWSLLILLWLLFVVLLIIAYRQVMYHHSEIKNNNQPKTA